MWTVIYSHGRDGHPWDDPRIQVIKKTAETLAIEMQSIGYDEAHSVPVMIEKAIEICTPKNNTTNKLILFGSSRGAFIASAVSRHLFETGNQKPAGLFMMAPAIGIKPHYYPEHFPVPAAQHCMVIHPYNDEVVPYQHVVDFCARHKINLQLVEDTHILHKQVDYIEAQVRVFLKKITG